MLKVPDFYNEKYSSYIKTNKSFIFKTKMLFKDCRQLAVFLPKINIFELKKNTKIIKQLLSIKKIKLQKHMHAEKIFKYWFSNKIARGYFAQQIPKNVLNKRQKYFYLKKKMKNYIKQSKLKKKPAVTNPKRKTKIKLFLKKYALFKNWKFLNKKQRYQKKIIYCKNFKQYKNTVHQIVNPNKDIFLKKIKKKYVNK